MSISVLMSVYNKEKPEYLRSSLESIWDEQILKPDEIILIQDGPLSDELKSKIHSFAKKVGSAFKTIKLAENVGLTKALNIGIKECTCDFIARMDSDDISTANRFRIQYDFFHVHKEIDIIGGAIEEFDDYNRIIGIRQYPLDYESFRTQICKTSPLAHPSVMFRRKIFDEGNKYPENYRTTQDLAFWFILLKKGYKFSNINEPILKFRRIDDLYKRRSRSKAFEEFKIYINGIKSLHGLTYYYIFPIARLIFRLLP